MSRPIVIAAVVGVIVLGTFATMVGLSPFAAEPAGRRTRPTPEPSSLCDHLEHLLNEGPVPAEEVTPTAVLTDPRLGDLVTPPSEVEAPDPDAVEDLGPNGAAATYILAQDGLISGTGDQVRIPDEIADDYLIFTSELYRLVFEEPGSNGTPTPESLVAAGRLDAFVATCRPS
jgi:hypothetical protein